MSDLNTNVYSNASITFDTAKEVLNVLFGTTIAAMTDPLTVIAENIQADTPATGYIQFTVRQAGTIKDGSGSYENVGLATADVYTPLGTGYAQSTAVYQAVEDAFLDLRWAYDVMSILSVKPNTLGDSGSFYHTQVDIAFRYNHKV